MINSANGFPSIADKTINIDGINIAYKDEGSGQIILCLHALGHSSKDFASLYMDISLKVYQHFSAKFTTRRELLKLI